MKTFVCSTLRFRALSIVAIHRQPTRAERRPLHPVRRGISGARARLLVALSAALCLAAAEAPGASAAEALAPVSPYGEVARFGSFVEGGGQSTFGSPASFDIPVGFAVDRENQPDPEEQRVSSATADGNAVYVLDRVLYSRAEGHLQYRLQKLSSTGVVLGSVTLPLQSFQDTEHLSDAHPMFGLAVDSAKHRVYALVEGHVEGEPGSEQFETTASYLLAWSTQPHQEGSEEKLVPAGGYSEEQYGGAVVAGPSVLEPEPAKDLVVPEGLAVNPKTHEVVIEAQHGTNSSAFGGATILQNVTTEGMAQLGSAWVSPNSEPGAGIFTSSVGSGANHEEFSYGIDLWHERGAASRLTEVTPDLTAASPLAGYASEAQELNDRDQAPSIDAPVTPNRNGSFNKGTVQVDAAGSPITQLSSNGFYAARYGFNSEAKQDHQSANSPWTGLVPPAPFEVYWSEESPNTGLPNMGVRLFTASGAVITTIGGQPTGECSLETSQLSLAAGANGSLFVLSQPSEAQGNIHDEVIEFAPGVASGSPGACPVPHIGKVLITQNGEPAGTGKNGEAVVHQGAPVRFEVEASSIERAGEALYEFAWNVNGSSFTLGTKMEPPEFLWPKPVFEHQYTPAEIGTHEGNVRMSGDYGTVEASTPFTIAVLGSGSAEAQIATPASITEGQPVTFDGGASKPTQGSSIIEYRWEFSDEPGHVLERGTGETQAAHTFTKSGVYGVKLKIFDAVGGEAVVEKQVTVAPAAHGCEVNCGGGGNNTTTNNTTTTTTSTTSSVLPGPKPGSGKSGGAESNAQKLKAALKACKKDKKRKRAACEAQAHKKYGPPSKKKRKKR
jgi:PKD domain